MANHLHLALRTLPRVAKRWLPQEVARRGLTITKLAKCMSDALPTPDRKRVEQPISPRKPANVFVKPTLFSVVGRILVKAARLQRVFGGIGFSLVDPPVFKRGPRSTLKRPSARGARTVRCGLQGPGR